MAYLIKRGTRFYLRYWQDGHRIEESTGLVSEREAQLEHLVPPAKSSATSAVILSVTVTEADLRALRRWRP